MLELRQVAADDWRLWRSVRLLALEEAPYAFGSTLASWTGDGDTEARWRARLDDVPFNVVAVVDGSPAGQVSCMVEDDGARFELISMYVAPPARGRGVGEALIGEVLRWAGTQGASTVTLAVKEGNDAAIRLYERTGFTVTGAAPVGGELVLVRSLES